MKKIACCVILAGLLASTYATDARVFTMGGNDNFFMDDYSIFKNPANISYYPNMLIGSPGVYNAGANDTVTTAGNYAALALKNNDPQRPYFGPILSYSLNQSSDAGTQYPLLSLGLILNRYDEMLTYLDYSSTDVQKQYNLSKKACVLAPVGKVDVMLGYAMQNGVMIGAGTYLAFQKKDTAGQTLESNIYRGNVGANCPIGKSMNLEVSLGITSLKSIVMDTSASASITDTIADNDVSVRGDIRLFSALMTMNGDFVPHIGFDYTKLKHFSDFSFTGGLGVNINIDKGFFWAGAEGLYEAKNFDSLMGISSSSPSGIGGRISAGLERNVIFDWLVWRIGVQKSLMYWSDAGTNGHWEQNAEADGSNKDAFAFGLGLNIENRFKVDVVMSENILYTWTNLFSGSSHHLTNRITATYSF